MSDLDQTGFFIDTDGIRLLGTIFLAGHKAPTALLLHGIPGIEKNYDLAHELRRNGWNAVIFHYRGCWGSSGAYNVTTIPHDVRAVVDWLSSGKIPQVDPEMLVVIGHSLGGWAAVISAANDPRLRAVAALGAISDPAEFPLADPEYAAGYTPWLTGITPEELSRQWAGVDDSLTPTKLVYRIAPRPLLIAHGTADETVPFLHANRLHKAYEERSRFIPFFEANHSFTKHRDWLCTTVITWLQNIKNSLPFAKSDVVYRILQPSDIQAAASLLTEVGLPLAGFPDDITLGIGAFTEDGLFGCAALEVHGQSALIRSVAVAPALQGRSIGKELIHSVLTHAAARNLQQVFLLTETAVDYFSRFGFFTIPRSKVSRKVQASIEFTSACPQSAFAMRKWLGD